MPTYTLTQNESWSTITGSVASGDVVDLAGFTLNLDVLTPAQTNISITSPGTAGKVTLVTGIFNTDGWSLTAGTVPLVDNLFLAHAPDFDFVGGTVTGAHAIASISGATINGDVRGGSASGACGIGSVAGTAKINGDVYGGTLGNAYGIPTLNRDSVVNGDVTATAGTAIGTNYGQVRGTVTGGSGFLVYGVGTNYGSIVGAVVGGSNFGSSGVNENYGNVVGDVTGGSASGAPAINRHSGIYVGLNGGTATDGTVPAFINPANSTFIIDGPTMLAAVPAGVLQVYHVGAIAGSFGGSPTFTSIGGGQAAPRIGSPFIRGVD